MIYQMRFYRIGDALQIDTLFFIEKFVKMDAKSSEIKA